MKTTTVLVSAAVAAFMQTSTFADGVPGGRRLTYGMGAGRMQPSAPSRRK